MRNKIIILLISLLLFSCSEKNDDNGEFVDSQVYELTSFINDAENGDDSIFIIAETVEVISDDTENSNNFSRIITIKKEEESEFQTLSFYLNLDENGNTIGVSSVIYEFFKNDILNTYSYSETISNEDNPQSLSYTIIESTGTRFNINMSMVLSQFDTTDNEYTTLEVTDIGLDVVF